MYIFVLVFKKQSLLQNYTISVGDLSGPLDQVSLNPICQEVREISNSVVRNLTCNGAMSGKYIDYRGA